MSFGRRLEEFFLRPASTRPLAVLRTGLGLVLLAQGLMLKDSLEAFFSSDGIVQGALAQALTVPGVPRISGLIHALGFIPLNEGQWIHLLCGAYFASVLLMTLGLLGRPVIAVSWFLHWMLMNTSQTTTYGVDLYTHAFLFYLIWVPSDFNAPPSSGARLGLRVLQLHLCVTYLCSAVEKATGVQWWNGELLWRALNLPVYRQFDMLWLARYPWIPTVAGLGSLALEFGYIVFIWPKKTRRFWVMGIVGLHLGIAVFLGLTLFGVLMALLTLALFGVTAEPVPFVRCTDSPLATRSQYSYR